MKTFAATFLLTSILVITGITSFAQNAEQLYQKGLMKEEGEGNLLEAINIFNHIVEDQNADKAIQAKALLHVGLCYEKLGLKEATKAYQRLVNNFPGQKNEVAIARKRLSGLILTTEKDSKTPLTPKFTKINIPTKPGNGVLSPDGKDLAYVSEESLWILPVHGKTNSDIAGEPVRLTEPMGIWDVSNMGIVWSSNGKWLAYQATKTGEDKRKIEEIYVISATGGKPVKVNLDLRQNLLGYDYRMSLSPDGKILAFVNRDEYKKSAIFSISVDGGTQTKLTGPGTREPAFSPDGKLIAYVNINPQNELGNEIWVIPSTGGNPVLVNNNAGVVKSPVWSPDGSMIAFLARKYKKGWNNASNELWIVPINKNSGLTELAAKISLDYSTSSMLSGWSQDNKIGFWFDTPYKNVLYTVQATGGQAMQVTPKNSWIPGWSPDGQYLFFEGTNTDDWAGIEAIPVDGGDVTKIPVVSEYAVQPGMPTGGISVSPDGKKIVFAGYYYNISDTVVQKKLEGSHIMTIPASGGKPFQLTTNPPMGDGYPTWSPDGKTIAFMRVEKINANNTSAISFDIYTIPAEGGTPKKITSSSDKVGKGRINWSPDGKWIGFYSDDKAIKVISPEGGNSKIVINDVEPDMLDGLSFSPDGNKIVFSNKNKLFTVDLNGENKAEVKTGLDEIHTMPAWSPDGKKIAFSANNTEETDLWLMENFLPLEKLSQNKESGAAKERKGIAIRLLSSDLNNTSSISADGEYVALADWDTGNLEIRNLKTGEKKLATNDGTWIEPMQYTEYNLISPDGKLVAYQWYNSEGVIELRLTKVDTQIPSILYTCDKDEYVIPRLWFPDSKKLIAQRSNSKTKTVQLLSIDLTNRDTQVLKENSGKYYKVNLSLSPDQKQVAFDFPNPSDQGLYDISLLSLDTKQEIQVIKHPANDRLIGWLPGRNELLFTSDRSGATDIWSVRTPGKEEIEVPRRIMTNIGDLDPVGLTEDGSLYYLLSKNNYESFIIPCEGNGTKVSMNSRTSLPGQVFDVSWLPDGESILCYGFIPEKFKRRGLQNLFVVNSVTGEARALATNLTTSGQLRISPNGKSVLIFGFDQQRSNEKDYKGGIYIVNIETGTPIEIKIKQDFAPISGTFEWDKEGKNIFYAGNNQVIKHNIESNEEKIIYNERQFTYTNIVRSVDGNKLIIDIMVDKTGSDCQLFSINENGGEAKLLCTHKDVSNIRLRRMVLSPDGKYIYFSSLPDDWKTGLKSILCRIPSTGGTPENLWQSKEYFIAGMSIHPEGNKMALSTLELGSDMRVIENLIFGVEKIYNKNE
jgi:Tol biopolymer transport system component